MVGCDLGDLWVISCLVYGVVCWDTDRQPETVTYQMPRLDVVYIDIMLRCTFTRQRAATGEDPLV